jgi:hypothetical protein
MFCFGIGIYFNHARATAKTATLLKLADADPDEI